MYPDEGLCIAWAKTNGLRNLVDSGFHDAVLQVGGALGGSAVTLGDVGRLCYVPDRRTKITFS